MARKDTVLLFIPAIIGGIILLSIFLLDIQLANFQEAYFQEVGEETKRNNFYLVRVFRDLLESNQLDKMHRMLNSNHGPNPMIVKIIARGKGVIMETEGVPAYLVAHIREPEIKDIFKTNRDEDVLVKFDKTLNSFMVYHSVRFRAGGQDYVLVMASKCNSMTLLMRQTRQGILILTVLGILSTLTLITYFCYWIRSPLNRLFASMSKIAAGELEYPVYIPKSGLIREIALCLQSLTEQLKKQILSLRDDANEREAILNALTEAVLLIDADGRVRQWNKTAGNLFYPEKKGWRNRRAGVSGGTSGIHQASRTKRQLFGGTSHQAGGTGLPAPRQRSLLHPCRPLFLSGFRNRPFRHQEAGSLPQRIHCGDLSRNEDPADRHRRSR